MPYAPRAPRRRKKNSKKGMSAPTRHRLLSQYNKLLERTTEIMGHNSTTSNFALEDALKKLRLQPFFVGTICELRALKKQGRLPMYSIANISCEPPGKHWVAYYRGTRYDPLGDDRSGSQEQPTKDKDCGQRCIAYLLLCRHYTRPILL